MSKGRGHQKKRKTQDEAALRRLRDARDGKARRAMRERQRLNDVARTE